MASVRRAGSGQRVVVSVDGRAVAQLGPIEPEHGQTVLEDLIAAGAAHRGGQVGSEFADTDHAYTSVHSTTGAGIARPHRIAP